MDSIDTSVLDEIKLVIETIWGTFFAWMPLSLQIAFGVIFGLSMVVLTFKVAALVLNAVPFL